MIDLQLKLVHDLEFLFKPLPCYFPEEPPLFIVGISRVERRPSFFAVNMQERRLRRRETGRPLYVQTTGKFEQERHVLIDFAESRWICCPGICPSLDGFQSCQPSN